MCKVTRRHFLEAGTLAAGTLFASGCETTPRIVQTRATHARKAGEKLNMGFVGVGGRGGNNFREFFDELGEQAVAICDVDMRPLNHLSEHIKKKQEQRRVSIGIIARCSPRRTIWMPSWSPHPTTHMRLQPLQP